MPEYQSLSESITIFFRLAEVRYTQVEGSPLPGVTTGVVPQKTSYMPVTLGIRW